MIANDCKLCDICISRKNIVNGHGERSANLMVIGEAPGYHEDKHGIPFVGMSGQFLRSVLKENGFDSNNIYVTNLIRCRPPENRTPTDIEIKNCFQYLYLEIKHIRPRVILLLGNTAKNFFYNRQQSMARDRGFLKLHRELKCMMIATYHPSYILQNPEKEDLFRKDIQKINEVYRKLNIQI